MAIPGFCSCGLSPVPSGGIQSSRAYGFEPKHNVITKKSVTAESVAVTYGISSRLRERFVHTAIAE